MKTIPLTQGFLAFVDDTDYPAVSAFKWNVIKDRGRFYAAKTIRRPDGAWRVLRLHNFLFPKAGPMDHKNGNGLDNQRSNLRPATKSQNGRGFRRKSVGVSSQFRGVGWYKATQKWQAGISYGGKRLHLGHFELEADAARAYDTAARKLFGDRATPNFP